MKILSEQVRVIAESRRFCMMMLMWTTVSLTFASATVDHRLSRDQGTEIQETCTGEVFEPRCHGDGVIVMLSARYGRMKIGRCVKEEPALVSIMEDPRYLGCSTDVLDVVSRQCSGRSECTMRVNDQNFNNAVPCYDSLKMYLETSYVCLSVAAETRYCTVSVSSGPQHIVDFGRTRQHSETLGSRCGDKSRPWTVDALNGQRIVVTLIDFTIRNHTIESQQQDAERCDVTYGDVIDKAARKNVSICRRAEQDGGLSRVYVSQSNLLHIVFTPAASPQRQQQQHNFIIHVEAVGCSDLVSPSDGAWLRRDGDEVIVGCYMSRQSWQLRCVDGVWTGTVGLCPQQQYHDDHQFVGSAGAILSDEDQRLTTNSANDFAMLLILAVSCSGVALCLVIICVGVACLRRQNRQMKSEKSAADVERLKPLNGSIDSYSVNLSATNDDVNLQWHQQQRQQLVM